MEDTSAQLTWRSLDPGGARLEIGETAIDIETDGGPGSIVVEGLSPATTVPIRLRTPAAMSPVRLGHLRTLQPPPGPELGRFATISDLHLGDWGFGRRNRITETTGHREPFTMRAARAALKELREWGAEAVVVKGDITSSGRVGQWEMLDDLIRAVEIPIHLMPGNHDTGAKRYDHRSHAPDWSAAMYGERIGFDEAVSRLGLEPVEPVRHVDIAGVRLVLVDTDAGDSGAGAIEHRQDAVVDLLATTPDPAVVLLHHQPMSTPVAYYRPVGIPSGESRRFVRAAREANPRLLITAGHTHRNRRRTLEGVTVTEVGSTKDYPGGWAGYVIHEGGIRQVVRRTGAPDVLAWTDRTASVALGAWGRWSPGRLADRCFSLPWPDVERS